MIKTTVLTLTEALISNKKSVFSVDFRVGYDAENEVEGDLWHAEILQMGHRNIVTVIRLLGDNVFAYDITYSDDHRDLYTALKDFDFGGYQFPASDEIWIDTNSTIALESNRAEDYPAEIADKYLQAMELLMFISDQFDHGCCHHTEIEERLDEFL